MTLIQQQIARLFSIRFALGSIALLSFLFGYWHWLGYQQFIQTPVNFPADQQQLVVNPGESINRLARRWQQQEVIEQAYYLKLLCRLNPHFKQIKAGEYQLDRDETPLSLMQKLSQGKVIQYAFTIIEGMNSFQILEQIQNNKRLKQNGLTDLSDLPKELDLPSSNLEGWLFPDTYYFAKADTALNLLSRASRKMQRVLNEEWQNRASDLPYVSPYEALIMASIIEKETALDSEREQIAGVFVRRLQKRMKLQTDPTVIYGIGPEFNGDITYRDLRNKTPYNTYLIKGLPPTPIAMPGRRSIHAALHPADGDALYFVASGDGGHVFSATLDEHNKAVKRFLKKKQ